VCDIATSIAHASEMFVRQRARASSDWGIVTPSALCSLSVDAS